MALSSSPADIPKALLQAMFSSFNGRGAFLFEGAGTGEQFRSGIQLQYAYWRSILEQLDLPPSPQGGVIHVPKRFASDCQQLRR